MKRVGQKLFDYDTVYRLCYPESVFRLRPKWWADLARQLPSFMDDGLY